MSKYVTKVKQVKDTFESYRTFVSLSATVLSCAAAWLGYQARVTHQERLENQLTSINEELKRDISEYEKQKIVKDAARTDFKSVCVKFCVKYNVTQLIDRRLQVLH
jgi:hypothetical protein